MFFLARSIFCIGLIACLLPATQRPTDLGSVARDAGAAAARQVEALCSAAPASCTEAAMSAAAAARRAMAAPLAGPSLDTLRPADLVPAWHGPTSRT